MENGWQKTHKFGTGTQETKSVVGWYLHMYIHEWISHQARWKKRKKRRKKDRTREFENGHHNPFQMLPSCYFQPNEIIMKSYLSYSDVSNSSQIVVILTMMMTRNKKIRVVVTIIVVVLVVIIDIIVNSSRSLLRSLKGSPSP